MTSTTSEAAMLEGEKLAGEVFKTCREWHVWEQVCDLMAACLTGAIKDRFHVGAGDEFLYFLEKKFPNKLHPMWVNVEIVRKLEKAS
jgi:hypothetical protein